MGHKCISSVGINVSIGTFKKFLKKCVDRSTSIGAAKKHIPRGF